MHTSYSMPELPIQTITSILADMLQVSNYGELKVTDYDMAVICTRYKVRLDSVDQCLQTLRGNIVVLKAQKGYLLIY